MLRTGSKSKGQLTVEKLVDYNSPYEVRLVLKGETNKGRTIVLLEQEAVSFTSKASQQFDLQW